MFTNLEDIKLIISCVFADADVNKDTLMLVNKNNIKDITVAEDYCFINNNLKINNREIAITSVDELEDGNIIDLGGYMLVLA